MNKMFLRFLGFLKKPNRLEAEHKSTAEQLDIDNYHYPNFLFRNAEHRLLTGDIDWCNDQLNVLLINESSTKTKLHRWEFLSDIDKAKRACDPVRLQGARYRHGALDADDVWFKNVGSFHGEETPITGIIIYKDTGTEETSPLILGVFNSANGEGRSRRLEIIPNGGDIFICWDNGFKKIFKVEGLVNVQ